MSPGNPRGSPHSAKSCALGGSSAGGPCRSAGRPRLPHRPRLAAEQGECVIVTQRQNLNQRQATGFSSQQKMPTHGAASWVSFMSISVRPDSLTACDCEKFRRRRAVASGRRALGWLLHKAVGFLRPCRHSSQSHGVPHALTQLTPDPLLDGCGDVLRSGEDQGLVTDVGSWREDVAVGELAQCRPKKKAPG